MISYQRGLLNKPWGGGHINQKTAWLSFVQETSTCKVNVHGGLMSFGFCVKMKAWQTNVAASNILIIAAGRRGSVQDTSTFPKYRCRGSTDLRDQMMRMAVLLHISPVITERSERCCHPMVMLCYPATLECGGGWLFNILAFSEQSCWPLPADPQCPSSCTNFSSCSWQSHTGEGPEFENTHTHAHPRTHKVKNTYG